MLQCETSAPFLGSCDLYGHQRSKATKLFQRKTKMNLVRSYNNWRRYRETIAELGKLSSRELNDLGINRGDIPFIARTSAAR